MKKLSPPASLPQKMRGFTLIEIAIVLVIVGLLLGGVLKGQEFIDNARSNRVISDVNGITAAVNTYIDRYGNRPNNDPGATRFGTDVFTGVGNASMGSQTHCLDGSGADNCQQARVWSNLRAAGLITGCGAYSQQECRRSPVNPWGSDYGIAGPTAAHGCTGDAAGGLSIRTVVPNVRVAESIDRRNDDGRPGLGTIMGGLGTATSATGCGAPTETYQELTTAGDPGSSVRLIFWNRP